MCIIAYKPEGVPVRWDWLDNCWHNNPDGAGFCYVEDGRVVIRKGYMGWQPFQQAVKTARLEARQVLFHFRLATHGKVGPGMCHPFPLTAGRRELLKRKVSTDCAVMHNGIITGTEADNVMSDSAAFVRDYLSAFSASELDTGRMANLLGIMDSGSFAFMFQNGAVRLIGDIEKANGESETRPWVFSNSGYRYKRQPIVWKPYVLPSRQDLRGDCDVCQSADVDLKPIEDGLRVCGWCEAIFKDDDWTRCGLSKPTLYRSKTQGRK